MTRKDTERLVREHMQQTIPDKDALWTRIEAGLPAQAPVQPVRKAPLRMHVIYRTMGAAACFLLILGGVGIWSAMHGVSKNESAPMLIGDAPQDEAVAGDNEMNDEAFEMNEDAAAEDYSGAGTYEGGGSYQENAQPQDPKSSYSAVSGEQSQHAGLSPATSGPPVNQAEGADDGNAADDANAAEAEPAVTLTGWLYGEPGVIDADASVCEELVTFTHADPGLALQESIDLGNAQENGIILSAQVEGQELTLVAVDGRYRVIYEKRVYHASEPLERFLKGLER